jgi:hypothetical protein
MTDRDLEPAWKLECMRELEFSIREAQEDREEYFRHRPGADDENHEHDVFTKKAGGRKAVMRNMVVGVLLAMVVAGCGIFDRGEATLTQAQVEALKAQVGGEITTQNAALMAALEKTLGAKIVAIEAKVDGTAKVTTAAPAEEATQAFGQGYKQGAEMGAAIAPGAGFPTVIASVLGGLIVGVGAAASVLLKRRAQVTTEPAPASSGGPTS